MANFREVFKNTHVILPVVHVESEEQAIINTGIAKEAGCDGVFLIDMHMRGHEKLFSIHRVVDRNFPDFWIGLNCLDVFPVSLFSMLPDKVNGVWADNAGIHEDWQKQPIAELILESKKESGWNGLYFGGVAFKYQEKVDDVAKVAKLAAEYMDVITTSGSATGKSPEVEKIRTMKEAIGAHPLAIASGISSENVKNYLGIANCFLVATSLLIPGTENFDPARVQSLVEKVRGCASRE